ncbi:MAG: anthranilate phosphoribosyltransferase family protein [Cyanobacteria bacterium P01_G01_bin.54]
MSAEFRELLKKVGSGPHTSKALTRSEAAHAAQLILDGTATPAQIGAFLIAHRMKRPVADELAGFLDTFDRHCPPLVALDLRSRVVVLGNPYDGRDRTVPLAPVTALILAAAQVPVLMHGGDRIATKFGLPLIEIWQALGVEFRHQSRTQVRQLLAQTQLSLLYTPEHFPATHAVNNYRAEVGKRPPLATVELIWTPYTGPVHLIAGFVHPPTERFMQETLALRGLGSYTLIKGLEGSGDLPRERTAIISTLHPDATTPERLKLRARDYDLQGPDLPLRSLEDLVEQIQTALAGEATEYFRAAVWNGGFYLWSAGAAESLEAGFDQARSLLESGAVAETLARLQQATQTPALV